MIQIIVPIFIGFLLLGILLYWFLRGEESAKCRLELSEAQTALKYLQSGSTSRDLIDRIANEQDIIFVRSEGDRNLLVLLNGERRAVALLWLRRMHQQVKLLMHFHVSSARSNARLGPVVELKLAFQFLAFIAIYYALLVMVWLRGPFRARKVTGFIAVALRQFCATSQQALVLADSWHAGLSQGSGKTASKS